MANSFIGGFVIQFLVGDQLISRSVGGYDCTADQLIKAARTSLEDVRNELEQVVTEVEKTVNR